MADEPIKPNPPVDTAALMAEVEALRKNTHVQYIQKKKKLMMIIIKHYL